MLCFLRNYSAPVIFIFLNRCTFNYHHRHIIMLFGQTSKFINSCQDCLLNFLCRKMSSRFQNIYNSTFAQLLFLFIHCLCNTVSIKKNKFILIIQETLSLWKVTYPVYFFNFAQSQKSDNRY